MATISNDNLQDLKTGQLVGATPWKQQVALIIGVLVGSVVMAPILQLMQAEFGFGRRRNSQRSGRRKPRSRWPRWLAELVAGRCRGMTGVIAVALDETLAKTTTNLRLPPLARVGMGMCLSAARR